MGQEALPNPKDEKDDEKVGNANSTGAPTAPAEAPPVAQEDPEAQKRAQAQWQMHYLAMAINASVPEVGPLSVKAGAPAPPASKGASKGKAKGHVAEGKINPKAKPVPWRSVGRAMPY